MHAFPRKNVRSAFLHRDGDHRSPPRMRSKADGGLLHASLRASLRPRGGGIFGTKHFVHSGGTPSTTCFAISRAFASSSEETSSDCLPWEIRRRTAILFSRRAAASMSANEVSSPHQTSVPPPSNSHSASSSASSPASSPASGGLGMYSALDGVSVSGSFRMTLA